LTSRDYSPDTPPLIMALSRKISDPSPDWLYLLMTRATGELHEYMQKSRDRQAGTACFTAEESVCLASSDPATWLRGLKSYTLRWIAEHLDGREDRWTSLTATPRPIDTPSSATAAAK
jgi:hypothetical protein